MPGRWTLTTTFSPVVSTARCTWAILAEPKASLGVLINNGYKALRSAPFLLIYPAIAIVLIMVCFSIVGDGLRDAFDPRMKH